MAVLSSNGFVDSSVGCEGPVGLVLDATSFYAEQGGQVADIGSLTSSSGHNFDVQDTQVNPHASDPELMSEAGAAAFVAATAAAATAQTAC